MMYNKKALEFAKSGLTTQQLIALGYSPFDALLAVKIAGSGYEWEDKSGYSIAWENALSQSFTASGEHALYQMGNIEQSGTPTPENPIPIQCVKAGSKIRVSTPITTVTAWINVSNQLSYSSDSFAARIEVKPNTQYELYLDAAVSTLFRAGVTASANLPMTGSPIGLSPCVRDNTPNHITLNTGTNAKYIWVQLAAGQRQAIYSLTVINKASGKTYKPFSLSEITTPCDLYTGDMWFPISGKVERSKKRLELTGTEGWNNTSITNALNFFMPNNPRKRYADGGSMWSNIAVGGFSAAPAAAQRAGKVFTVDSASYVAFGYKDSYTVAEWKAYLAAQYAAGTPVYIVYDLETPITEQYEPQPLFALQGDVDLTQIAQGLQGMLFAGLKVRT